MGLYAELPQQQRILAGCRLAEKSWHLAGHRGAYRAAGDDYLCSIDEYAVWHRAIAVQILADFAGGERRDLCAGGDREAPDTRLAPGSLTYVGWRKASQFFIKLTLFLRLLGRLLMALVCME